MISKIGITGNIGSGKSTVGGMFRDYGFNYLDSDKLVHGYYENNDVVYKLVIEEFGQEILDANYNIDRRKLGEIVFSDENKLRTLEEISYSQLRDDLGKLPRDKMFFIEGALLFEKGFGKYFDLNILVYVPKDVSRERAIGRGMAEDEFEKRWSFQMSPEEKMDYADVTIDNSLDLDYTKLQVKEFIRQNVSEYL